MSAEVCLAEIVYTVWRKRNELIFQSHNNKELNSKEIIQNVMWRVKTNDKLAFVVDLACLDCLIGVCNTVFGMKLFYLIQIFFIKNSQIKLDID